MATLAIEIMRDMGKARRGGGYYSEYGDRGPMPMEDEGSYAEERPTMSGEEGRMVAKEFMRAIEKGDTRGMMDAFKAMMFACER